MFYIHLYNVYVLPILENACEIWSPQDVGSREKIEKVQKYFTRRLLGTHLSYVERIAQLNMFSLESRRAQRDVILFRKFIDGNLFVSFKVDQRVSITRGNGNINVPYCRTTTKKNLWFFRSIKMWNSLPIDVRNYGFNAFRLFVKCIKFDYLCT